MFGLGPTELIIIAIIVLLIFGAKRLPEIGKGMGSAIKEFKKVKQEISSGTTDEDQEKEKTVLKEDDQPPALEDKVVNKVLEQVPGVKKAVDVKKKADKIKEILK